MEREIPVRWYAVVTLDVKEDSQWEKQGMIRFWEYVHHWSGEEIEQGRFRGLNDKCHHLCILIFIMED